MALFSSRQGNRRTGDLRKGKPHYNDEQTTRCLRGQRTRLAERSNIPIIKEPNLHARASTACQWWRGAGGVVKQTYPGWGTDSLCADPLLLGLTKTAQHSRQGLEDGHYSLHYMQLACQRCAAVEKRKQDKKPTRLVPLPSGFAVGGRRRRRRWVG